MDRVDADATSAPVTAPAEVPTRRSGEPGRASAKGRPASRGRPGQAIRAISLDRPDDLIELLGPELNRFAPRQEVRSRYLSP